MPRNVGSKNGRRESHARYVRVLYSRGMLEQRGAKAELARIMHVSRGYITQLVQYVEAQGSADTSEVNADLG